MGDVAPGWLISTHWPDGTVNLGAELHPESKAAQSGTLARSLLFM